MAWVNITSYYLRYNTQQQQCIVGVYFREDGSAEARMVSEHFTVPAAEAAFLADMLRNEKPVYFDPETEAIATAKEAVGEGEISNP